MLLSVARHRMMCLGERKEGDQGEVACEENIMSYVMGSAGAGLGVQRRVQAQSAHDRDERSHDRRSRDKDHSPVGFILVFSQRAEAIACWCRGEALETWALSCW